MRHKRRAYSLSLRTTARASGTSRVGIYWYAQTNLIDQAEIELPHDPNATELAEDLRWYLEDFLEDGSAPSQARAARVRAAIEAVGVALFRTLFVSSPDGARLWKRAQRYLPLTEIEADLVDPIPGVPWEILQSPDNHAPLALSTGSFIRTERAEPSPDREKSTLRQTCRILLVISRPRGTADIAFRSVASKLFEALSSNTAFEVMVLRPPTFSACAEALRDAARAGTPFDIVHFDGHGLHVRGDDDANPSLSRGGYVLFENEDAEDALAVSGRDFGALIAETGTPSVVLNACRSSYSETAAKGSSYSPPVVSFATEVIRAGACQVVAMAYDLYVFSAMRFMKEFYRVLATGQSLPVAASAARKYLAADKRTSFSSESNILDDWLVPRVFQSPQKASFHYEPPSPNRPPSSKNKIVAADAALPPPPDFGFVGSDDGLLLIDRTFDKSKIALLYGLAGAGKTAAAVEFGRWYTATNNSVQTVLFTSFEEPKTIDALIAPLESFIASGSKRQRWSRAGYIARRQIALETLDEMRTLWIWDNVDTIPLLPKKERDKLLDFLKRATSTGARFLLTARDRQEEWLGATCTAVRMPPLRFSESVEFASQLIQKLALKDISLPSIKPILEYAQGNPLTLSIALAAFLDLAQLPSADSARQFVQSLQVGELNFETHSSQGRSKALLASLQYGFERAFSEAELHPFALLTDFRNYLNTWVIMLMCVPPVDPAKMGFADWDFGWTLREFAEITPFEIESLLVKSSRLGLLRQAADNHFWMHPAIQIHLRTFFQRFYPSDADADRVHRAFAESIAVFSTYFSMAYTHGFRERTIEPLTNEEENLHRALSLSHEKGWFQAEIGVLQGLFALYSHKGSLIRWADLFASVLHDFVDDHWRPLPGREKWWPFIMDHQWRMVFERSDLAEAEDLARSILAWETSNSAKIDRTNPSQLTLAETQQLRFLAISTSRLADVLRETNNPTCISMSEEAIRLYQLISDKVGEAVRLFNLGHAYKNVPVLRDLAKAADYYTAALHCYPDHDPLARGQCLAQLGAVSLELLRDSQQKGAPEAVALSHLEDAIRFYEKALELEPADAVANVALTHNQLGAAYQYSQTEQSKAVDHFKKAMHYFAQSGQSFGQAGACLNAAQVLLRFADPYEAKDYATEGLRILESSNYSGPEVARAKSMLREIDKKIRTKGRSYRK